MIYTPKIAVPLEEGSNLYRGIMDYPEFRGKGIAKQLVKKVFECQKETGAVEVRLYTGEDNIIAQELYKKYGMQIMSKAVFMKSE